MAFGAALGLEVAVFVVLALAALGAAALFEVTAFLGATAVFGRAAVALGGGAGLVCRTRVKTGSQKAGSTSTSFADAASVAFTCGVNLTRPEGPENQD